MHWSYVFLALTHWIEIFSLFFRKILFIIVPKLWLIRVISCRISTNSHEIEALVQERRNSSALAMELHLSCTNPSKWKCFLQRWPFVSRFHQLLVDSLHKGSVMRTFDISLMLAWTNSSVAGDLRCHDADVKSPYCIDLWDSMCGLFSCWDFDESHHQDYVQSCDHQ